MPFGRGSSGGSSVIAEGIRAGTAPSAILLLEPDEIVTLGAIVADELYGESMSVVGLAVRWGSWRFLRSCDVRLGIMILQDNHCMEVCKRTVLSENPSDVSPRVRVLH